MATLKFKCASPYATPNPVAPQEDYLFQKYLQSLSTKSKDLDDPIIKVALFGAGRAGTIHLGSIKENPRVQLLYIVDDIESKWEGVKKYWRLSGVTFLTSKQSDKVFKDPNVDAVIVATPTFTHEDIVVRALNAKKAVFCEKPIAEDRANAVKCYETAKKVGKPLFCAFNRRFDPSYNAVRDRVRNGEIGHVHVIKTTARDSPLPGIDYLKTSGGIFHDCLVHDIDIITWVLGEYPTKVMCTAHAHIPEIKAINDFDTVVITLYFPSGTIGMIDNSRNSCYGYDQRLECFGPKGMVNATNEQPIHCVTTQQELNGLRTAPIWYSFPSRFRLAYYLELDHFLDVVVGREQSKVQSKETLAVSRIATCCEEAARTGKAIEIKWANDELPQMN